MKPTFSLAGAACLLLIACGGGGAAKGPPTAVPAPADSTAASPVLPQTRVHSKADAARLLTQATFGPTLEEIDALYAAADADAWLSTQREQEASLQLPQLRELQQQGIKLTPDHRMEAWWRNALIGRDQLRQRMAFALSEILVVSDQDKTLAAHPEGMAAYYDLLSRHALGNYRELLEAVTLAPAMGRYLSMFRNRAPDPERGLRSDENFAREVMQLFTIGLVQLNADGTPELGSDGQTRPTYTQDDVEALARAFTGWAWSAGNFLDDSTADWTRPLEPDDAYHDSTAKRIVGGVDIPAGLGARAELERVLDALFAHDNVGPFIGKQLIQRLVTSNPSPAYVARVARVFDDNGEGVRGDLFAVARAILLDPEARSGHLASPQRFGKLREPLLRVTALWRAFDARMIDGRFSYANPENAFGQAPLRATSVFNFFRPDYAPNGPLAEARMVAPELQLADDSALNLGANVLFLMSYWYRHNAGATIDQPGYFVLDYRGWEALAEKPEVLVDRLNLLLMSGQMPPAMRQQIIEHLTQSSWQFPAQAVAEAVMLVVTSPQFAIQR